MAKKKYSVELLNEEFGKEVVQEYLSGSHASDLAQKYLNNKKDFRYINYILQMNKVNIRSRSEVKQLSDKINSNSHLNGKRHEVNSNYFKTWSHNMAYLLGYIATDGCISDGRVLKFGLLNQDEPFLYKVKEEMNFSGNVYQRKIKNNKTQKEYNSSYMNIYDREIYSDLFSLGICENKSLKLGRFDFIPEEFEMSFLLGVFDGDGSIGLCGGEKCKNNVQIRLRYFSGSLEFITYVKDIMIKHGYKDIKIKEEQRKNPFYSLCYSTKDAIKFYEEAYSNVSIWIDRKKEKYDSLIEKRKIYESSKENSNILKVKTI